MRHDTTPIPSYVTQFSMPRPGRLSLSGFGFNRIVPKHLPWFLVGPTFRLSRGNGQCPIAGPQMSASTNTVSSARLPQRPRTLFLRHICVRRLWTSASRTSVVVPSMLWLATRSTRKKCIVYRNSSMAAAHRRVLEVVSHFCWRQRQYCFATPL